MDKQAWCIKGSDGFVYIGTCRMFESDAWTAWEQANHPPDRRAWIAEGYRAVPVTVSEQNAAGLDYGTPEGRLLADIAPAAAPSEFVMVPREPTEEMFYAFKAEWDRLQRRSIDAFSAAYKTMLAAAPPCPDAGLAEEIAQRVWKEQGWASRRNDNHLSSEWALCLAAVTATLRGGRHD